MSMMQSILNSVRRLDALFPGYFNQLAKHDHKKDFGWPEHLRFEDFFRAYSRNGIAAAAVDKTVNKTWQEHPVLIETEDTEQTPREKEVADWFRKIRFWQRLAEADRRALVGGYAGVIFRFADNKRFQEPVDQVPGGIEGLVEIIPAWAGQLRVSTWDTDEASPTYGHPKMFAFNEAQVMQPGEEAVTKTRSFELHPDRVFVWSADGTIHSPSALQAGFNDLIDLEKVKGAGGEGFWKNAKAAPVLEIDKDAKIEDMAAAMGVPVSEIVDKMNEQIDDFNKGFDKTLLLQGIVAKQLPVTLPSPEFFWNVPLQSFAASFGIPLKILVGNQTGERASTEDAKDWAQTCNARRENSSIPSIEGIVERLVSFGILAEADWTLDWPDLTESTMEEKLARAERMATINSKTPEEPVFLVEEIRDVVDMQPLQNVDDDTDDTEDPPSDGDPLPPLNKSKVTK